MTEQQKAVIALSVYNALSLTGRDQTIGELVNFLRAGWRPAWGASHEVITDEVVAEAAQMLTELGHVLRTGEHVVISIRDPRTRRGRTLQLSQDWSRIVPFEHAEAAR